MPKEATGSFCFRGTSGGVREGSFEVDSGTETGCENTKGVRVVRAKFISRVLHELRHQKIIRGLRDRCGSSIPRAGGAGRNALDPGQGGACYRIRSVLTPPSL